MTRQKLAMVTRQNFFNLPGFFLFPNSFILHVAAVPTTSSTTHWFINGSWSQGIDLPEARRNHAAIWVSITEILICGGFDAANIKSSRCWMYYDLAAPFFNELAPMAHAKTDATLGQATKSNGER